MGERNASWYRPWREKSSIRDILVNHNPKLADGGGYQFCKCKSNSRELDHYLQMVLSSPRALQSCGGNSRTYIRPLQADLDLTRIDEYEKVN